MARGKGAQAGAVSYHYLAAAAAAGVAAAGIAAACACCCLGCRATDTGVPVGELLSYQSWQVVSAPPFCCLLQRRYQLLRAAVKGCHVALCCR